ncbi:MAG: glycosyltransferase [Candidatus Sumerlaeia bacterium]
MISIVMPCYNGARWMGEALASVAAQTRPDWEVVIVDDGSQDDSAGVAREWAGRDGRIRFLQQANAGAAAARNAGVRASGGEYLVFLDCDDLLEPDFLQTMAAVLDADTSIGGCACEQTVMRTDGSTPVQPLPGGGDRLTIDDILPCNGWAPHAAMTRRAIFERIGGFNPTFRGSEDWDFWLRSLAVGNFAAVRRPLVRYRRHDRQTSGNYAMMAAHVMRVLDGFEKLHAPIVARYGRRRYRENGAMLILVYAGKALKEKQTALAFKLSFLALRRAFTLPVMRRLAVMWLPAWLTNILANR